MSEQSNKLLIKNHESCLNGFTSCSEVNVTMSNNLVSGRDCGRGCCRCQMIIAIAVVIVRILLIKRMHLTKVG